jgi:site-specific DNA-methyltransferase (adenine-specific)
MVVNIEDAGFEIRDQIMWIYGSGFPKSHNIGKSVDKLEGNDREVVGISKNQRLNKADMSIEPLNSLKGELIDTKGNSKYEGWGTALKPANEPICLARKPLSEKTVAENVIKYSTGGINIDGCRIGFTDGEKNPSTERYKYVRNVDKMFDSQVGFKKTENNDYYKESQGRFPANIIFECICDEVIKGEKGEVKKSGGSRDGLDITHEWGYGEINRTTYTDKGDVHTNPDCPCRLLDEQSGQSKSVGGKGEATKKSLDRTDIGYGYKKIDDDSGLGGYLDKGGASRFFYIAKVSKSERNLGLDKNNHPTVKPINLMTYLCRLITPKGGTVLDPFMGSGSSGISACLEGFNFIGMEMDEDYFKIAEARINNFEQYRKLLK